MKRERNFIIAQDLRMVIPFPKENTEILNQKHLSFESFRRKLFEVLIPEKYMSELGT